MVLTNNAVAEVNDRVSVNPKGGFAWGSTITPHMGYPSLNKNTPEGVCLGSEREP